MLSIQRCLTLLMQYLYQYQYCNIIMIKEPTPQQTSQLIRNSQIDETYFCYLPIKLPPQTYIGGVLLLLALTLFIKSLTQYYKARKVPTVTIVVQIIYFTIFTWSLVYITKILISEYMFLNYDFEEEQKQPVNLYQFYSIGSKVIFVLDATSMFLVQAVLILVCYNWMDNIVRQLKRLIEFADTEVSESHKVSVEDQNDALQKVSNITDSYHNNLQDRSSRPVSMPKKQIKTPFFKQLQCQTIFRNVLRIYLVLRFFVYFLVIPFVICDEQRVETIIVKIMLGALLSQALLVFFTLILGYGLIRNNKRLKELVSQSQIDLISNQYSILIICSMIRLALDIIFIMYNFESLSNSKKCLPTPEGLGRATRVEHIIKFALEAVFTHFLAIFVVLRIYNIQDKEVEICNSLLATEKYQQKFQSQRKQSN